MTSVPVLIDADDESCRHAGSRSGGAAAGRMAPMQFWKPHSLAKPHEGQLDLRLGDKVRASVDLPGVAAGTEGKVILANGFNWQRYRVLFTDGSELGDLDHRHLEPIGRAARRLRQGRGPRLLTRGTRFRHHRGGRPRRRA